MIAAIVFAVAGGLLTWGANFANDYVHDELSSQSVFFPDEASLREEGRDDLVRYADQQVTTGSEAQAYASFIGGHMEGIADGKTYAEIDDRGAAQAVADARESGASEAKISDLQATVDELKAQRDSLFRGQTLRATAVELRLVDDRADRRHRRLGRLRRRRRHDCPRRRRAGPPAPHEGLTARRRARADAATARDDRRAPGPAIIVFDQETDWLRPRGPPGCAYLARGGGRSA